MVLDIEAPALIRAASGGCVAALGAFALTRRPLTPRAVGLGGFLLSLGALIVAVNLQWVGSPVGQASALLLNAGGAAALVWLIWHEARHDGRALMQGFALLGLVAVPAGVFASTLTLGWIFLAARLVNAVQLGAQVAILFVLASAYARASADRRAPIAWMAGGLAALLGSFVGGSFQSESETARNAGLVVGLGIAVAALAWVTASRTRPSAHARGVVLATLGVTLLALALGALLDGDRGQSGSLRLATVGALAFGVFRRDLLGVPLARATAQRGALSALALATTFIVAEVAQNFVSAEYGLLAGGVAAGGLLFAVAPLQRALESRSHGVGAGGGRVDVYRDAVRYALRDGVVTRREDVHLAQLAQELGIGAADALRVRHDVEDEREHVKRNP